MEGKKGLTIGVLVGKPKGAPMDEPEEMAEESGELPPGLVTAVSELRAALADGSDEDAAKAFQSAMQCCGGME